MKNQLSITYNEYSEKVNAVMETISHLWFDDDYSELEDWGIEIIEDALRELLSQLEIRIVAPQI